MYVGGRAFKYPAVFGEDPEVLVPASLVVSNCCCGDHRSGRNDIRIRVREATFAFDEQGCLYLVDDPRVVLRPAYTARRVMERRASVQNKN